MPLALQELTLPNIVGAGNRRVVGVRRFAGTVKTPEQVGAYRVEEIVAVEVLPIETIDECQRRSRSVDFGHRNRAVQRHDGTGRERHQLVVELDDLPPVRGGRDGCVAVDGLDRGLDLIGAGLVPRQATPDDGVPLGDEAAVPLRPVLLAEKDDVAARRRTCQRRDSTSSMSAISPMTSGSIGMQAGEEPSEANRLRAEIVAHQPVAGARAVALR